MMQVFIEKKPFIVVVNNCFITAIKIFKKVNIARELIYVPNHRWYFDNRFLAVNSTVCRFILWQINVSLINHLHYIRKIVVFITVLIWQRIYINCFFFIVK